MTATDTGLSPRTPPFRRASVRDLMTEGMISCSPETPLREVARLMAVHKVHGIFVFEEDRDDVEASRLWGLVSDLDVVAASRGDIDRRTAGDRKSTRLNSSHLGISYAVFCLKKKNKHK